MGCFSYTCAISGLGIEAGDLVRYLLLTENPFKESRLVYMYGAWFPRTFPLRAVYDNYGSVKNVETGPQQDVWMEGLTIDLVPKGWGRNTYHDVPTSKGMSFEKLLKALREQRIFVKRHSDHGLKHVIETLDKHEPLAGVPTRSRVVKELEALGIPLFNGDRSVTSLVITGYRGDTVCVRLETASADFGKDALLLKEVEQKLKPKYATMIAAAHEEGPFGAYLRVEPYPGIESYDRSRPAKKSPPLRVEHAMIREDVWQAILKFRVQSECVTKTYGISEYYESARDMMHFYQGEHRQAAKLKRPPAITLTRIECDSRSNLVGSVVGQDVVPYTAGLATHFKLMMGKESVPHAFLDSVAELAFVQDVLASIRFWWKPSYSCGPQFPEWRDHVRFFNAMLKVSRDVEKRTAEAVAEDS